MTPAVPAEIAPPAIVPAPGMNFSRFVTTVLPRSVAPPAPIVEDSSAVIMLLFTSNPKITVSSAKKRGRESVIVLHFLMAVCNIFVEI